MGAIGALGQKLSDKAVRKVAPPIGHPPLIEAVSESDRWSQFRPNGLREKLSNRSDRRPGRGPVADGGSRGPSSPRAVAAAGRHLPELEALERLSVADTTTLPTPQHDQLRP